MKVWRSLVDIDHAREAAALFVCLCNVLHFDVISKFVRHGVVNLNTCS